MGVLVSGKRIFSGGIAGSLIVAMFIFVLVYLLARSVFLAAAGYTAIERILASAFLLSEGFVIFHAVGYFGNMYRLNKRPFASGADAVPEPAERPAVAVLIPARHEPEEVLMNTLTGCYNMAYPHKTVYLLDDSSEPAYSQGAARAAAYFGARVFRRQTPWHGAKAGIINDCLHTLSEKYVAILDADQVPMPQFLSKLVPLLEADTKIAFVQTPQFYSNLDESRTAFAAGMQQSVFYEYICEGKSSGEAMICCGTNVLVRKDALLGIGGFDESTVTEDFATSFKLHTRGWRSLYYNRVSVFGMGPLDLGSYFRQQNRWATGNVHMLREIIRGFFRNPSFLTPAQWFEYLVTGSYYFISWAYLFLVLCPIVYIFFGIPSFFMNPLVSSLSFMPYMILSLAIFYASFTQRNYDWRQIFRGQMLSFITLPVYLKASVSGLAGIKTPFHITAKKGDRCIPYRDLWPQMLFWALNLAALTWGVNRLVHERTLSLALNLVWVGYHFILCSSIFYFNEED